MTSALVWRGAAVELLERFCIPRGRDACDIIEVLVRACIAQPLARGHFHTGAAAHET